MRWSEMLLSSLNLKWQHDWGNQVEAVVLVARETALRLLRLLSCLLCALFHFHGEDIEL